MNHLTELYKDDIEKVLFSGDTVQRRIAELAAEIDAHYNGETVVAVGILKGAVFFYTDLVRCLKTPCEMEFMAISSYGASSKSSGVVRILKDLDVGIENKNILIIEDIVDSGLSLKYIIENLSVREAKSIKTCVMLDKPERRRTDMKPDFCGFSIPNEFVIGYGLDYNEKYRNLGDICVLKRSVYEV